jgi:uncharacterized protein YggL (DUF469 family)
MKKRIRKKLSLGEFRKTAYIHIDVQWTQGITGTESRALYRLWQVFLNGIGFRGYGIERQDGFCNAVYSTAGLPLTEDHRSMMKGWIEKRKEVDTFELSGIIPIDE